MQSLSIEIEVYHLKHVKLELHLGVLERIRILLLCQICGPCCARIIWLLVIQAIAQERAP